MRAQAEDIRHTFAGDDRNSFYVDDAGGSINNGGNDLSYYLNLRDVDQSAIGTLFLYANDGMTTTIDNGYAEEDFTDGSGINIFPLAITLPGTSAPGWIGLADDSPLTPVSFLGSQSGLTVEQVTYTSNDPADQFVIVEYRVVNNSTGAVTARLALSNDFDVDLKSADARVGFDDGTGIPFVFQQEQPPLDPTFTTIGVGLIRGALAQYRLEVCSGAFGACEILDDSDAIRAGFFNGASGQIGDLTQGIPNQDFAVTIAADLGSIPPGKGRSAVFCYNAANGTSAGDSIENCKEIAQNCENFYDNEIEICGNGLINFDEECDDGNNDTTDSCPSGPTGPCEPARCGDGFLYIGVEQCDDANDSTNDSCPSGPEGTCKPATCGDGYIWDTDGGTEQCDDANSNQNDSCPNCRPARCGDGFLWDEANGGTEQCDDGNNDTSDACPSGPEGACLPARCGDGFVWNQSPGTEQCDDANNATNDSCPNCKTAQCGDGFVWNTDGGEEVCDPGIPGSACSNNCTRFDSCGDGNIDPGEQCDDGNSNTNDACPDGPEHPCQNARCGDGFLQTGIEACDDGNIVDGDGCSSICQVEGANPDENPPPPLCGNGVKEGNEQCDDGNQKEDDACSNRCTLLPVLQGGGTSTNKPPAEATGGCALTASAPRSSQSWLGLSLPLFLAWAMRRRAA